MKLVNFKTDKNALNLQQDFSSFFIFPSVFFDVQAEKTVGELFFLLRFSSIEAYLSNDKRMKLTLSVM